MVLNGDCKMFIDGNLINYHITQLHSFTCEGGESGRDFSKYKGTVSVKDSKLIPFNKEPKSVFVFLSNSDLPSYGKIIEFTQCIIKKRYLINTIPFFSKVTHVILYFTTSNKTKIHDSDLIFRKDKINRIITNI